MPNPEGHTKAHALHLTCNVKPFQTITEELAAVSGAGFYQFTLPESPSARPNPHVIGHGLTPAQRKLNEALKQRLKDMRWMRHKDIPNDAWTQDSLGFYHRPWWFHGTPR